MKKKQLFYYSMIIFILIIAASGCSKKDELPEPEVKQLDIVAIDDKVDQWLTQNNMPGISLAISKNGKLVYSKGYGWTNVEAKTPVKAESQFRIASVSKLITSVAIMKLLEGGKVKMEDKVFGASGLLGTKYGTQPYKPYLTEVSLSDLLHHTIGGWGQDTDPAFFDVKLDVDAVTNWTLDNVALTKKPGSAFAYSNFGYMLLEKIVEKVSGKKYVDFVNDEIWSKVGSKYSAIAGSKQADKLANEAVYYGQGTDIPFVYPMNMGRAAGAMGWLSTANDLLRFATAVDGATTRPDILKSETIKTMTTTTPASVGFGWKFGCGWVVEGDEWFWWGSLPGSFAILYRNANGICIAATANSRLIPVPENALSRFFNISNFIADDKGISWQDIDQF